MLLISLLDGSAQQDLSVLPGVAGHLRGDLHHRERPRVSPPPGTRVAALVFDHVYGTVGLPYASSAASAPTAAVAGTWTPVTLPPPPGSADSYQLNGVACPTPATCMAAGYYGPEGAVRNLAETLSNGTWTPAGPPPPPPLGLADPNPSLNGMSCPGPGTCVAVGQYDQNSSPHGLVETLSGGTWTPAPALLPAGQAPLGAELNGISCPAPGSCVAVGAYNGQDHAEHPLVETLSGGTWTAVTAPLPAGITAATLNAVACATPGSCAVVGETGQLAGDLHALIETLSGGTWTPVKASLPAGATAKDEARLSSVACPAVGTCIATGFYTGPNGYHLLGLAETTGFAS